MTFYAHFNILLIAIAVTSIIPIENSWVGVSPRGIAIIRGGIGSSPISGTVNFEQNNIGLSIQVRIFGLPVPNSKHGFHVHEKGITILSDNIEQSCDSAGAHFNPFNSTHGDLNAPIRHLGDLGNLQADQNGNIITELIANDARLDGINGFLGRTIILHELEDDLGFGLNPESKKNGNSGRRIACGVIGVN